MGSPHEKEINLFKDLVWDNAIDAGIAVLNARVPWTAWGPFKWITEFIIEKFASELYTVVTDFLDVELIKMLNEKDQEQYTVTSIKLYEVANDFGIHSVQFQEAKRAAKKDFRDLIQYRIVA